MRGRLDLSTRFPQMRILVDFNDLGFSQIDNWPDITDYVLDVSGSKEKEGELLGGASSDLTTFTLDNSENVFSKDNPNGPFFGKIKNNVRFALKTGFKGETLNDYSLGYVESFAPRWVGKEMMMKTTCSMKKLKKAKVPTTSFKDITWDEAVNVLLDESGIDPYFVRDIPKTEYFFKYLKFEEPTCFDALKKLLEMAVGQAFFEGNRFVVTSKLALDYQLNTNEKHDIIVDDLFEFDENVDGQKIINQVEIKSEHKDIAPLQVLWETPENFVKIQNEQVTYDGADYVYISSANLPIYWEEGSEDITIKNLTTGADITWDLYNAEVGRIKLSAEGKALCTAGDLLSVSYTYQLLVIMPGATRKFVMNLEEEVDSILEPDVVAWNSDASAQIPFSLTPDTQGSLSKQSMYIKENGTIVELSLKNNTTDKVAISTLQLRGFPVKVLNPIEVYNKDLPSINEFETQEIIMTNNYINNVKLAEKLSQYMIDNNAQPRKEITIQINAYPELQLNDVTKVVEADSGTNHKFTIERIDFQFNLTNGWKATLHLMQLDTVQWVYETFSGQSYEKSNPGNAKVDFIKEINANLITNGGAELYTGCDDIKDVGAIGSKHIVPDYWRFVRLTGNATAVVRDGGNLVLHGSKSFEVTTTNSGTGYFEQIVDGIKPNVPYVLSFLGKCELCTGKAIIEQYNGSTLLQTEEVIINGYNEYQIAFTSLSNATQFVVQFHKLAGTAGSESFFFDKVKLENSTEASPYIETEETSAVQVNRTYANSVTLGNEYGIEVYDDLGVIKVRLGQYEPDKYGLKIYGGAIEIVNGLPEDQISSDATSKWNSAKDFVDTYANDGYLMPVEKRELLREWNIIQREYVAVTAQADNYWESTEQPAERTAYDTAYNNLQTYLFTTPDTNNNLPLLATNNLSNVSAIDRETFDSMITGYYDTKGDLETAIVNRAKFLADEAERKVAWKCEVYTYDGNVYMNGEGIKTIRAKVSRGPEDVTNLLTNDKFNWKRYSGDQNSDNIWNTNHSGVGSSILVDATEINKTTVFVCEILD